MAHFKSFYERCNDKAVVTKKSPVSLTKQGKALDVKEVIKRIGNGVTTEKDLFRRLPDDNEELHCVKDGDDIDGTDYVDLAISKQRMNILKEKAKADDEKTKKRLKKSAEDSSDSSPKADENI